jgi:hypothetical protein
MHANHVCFFRSPGPPHTNLLLLRLSPPVRDVGHPMLMSMDSMDFERGRGLGAGRKHEGRPVMRGTGKVCEEERHNQFSSLYLYFLLPY